MTLHNQNYLIYIIADNIHSPNMQSIQSGRLTWTFVPEGHNFSLSDKYAQIKALNFTFTNYY